MKLASLASLACLFSGALVAGAPLVVRLPGYAEGSLHFKAGGATARGDGELRQAWDRLNAGDAAGSLPLFEKVLAAEPTNADALVGRAIALASLGKVEEAIADLVTCIGNHPDYEPAWIILALIDESQGNHVCAQASLSVARKLYAKAGNLACVKGVDATVDGVKKQPGKRVVLAQKKTARTELMTLAAAIFAGKADGETGKAEKADQPDLGLLFKQMYSQWQSANYAAVVDLSNQILKLGPNPDALFLRAVAKLNLGDQSGVQDAIDLADRFPMYASGWLLLGELMEESGDPANAMACYETAYMVAQQAGRQDLMAVAAAHSTALVQLFFSKPARTVSRQGPDRSTTNR